MFKSFTLALLSAVAIAKGNNDGSSGDNAITTNLIDNEQYSLDVHTYNAETRDINEFHGDLEMTIKTGSSSNQEFGFCMKLDGLWDCMSVMTNLDPEKIEDADGVDPDYEERFAIMDGYSNAADITTTNQIETDMETSDSASYNWSNIAAKSYKTCTLDADTAEQPTDGSKIVTCEAVNAHWFRNFKTMQQDVNLDINTTPRVAYKVKGFRRKHQDGTYSNGGDYIWGLEKDIQLVTDNYQKMALGLEHGIEGTDSDNTINTVLYGEDEGQTDEGVVLTLAHYNRPPDTEGVEASSGTGKFYNSQFHGDLILSIAPGHFELSTQEFGFCIQYGGDDDLAWDCLDAKTTVIPSKIESDDEYQSEIQMVDSYWVGTDVPGAGEVLNTDEGWNELFVAKTIDHTTSWQNIKAKSFKDCSLDSLFEGTQPEDEDNFKFIECEAINAHFYRDFITLGDDQMLDALATNEFQVVGYQRDHAKADFSEGGAYSWGDIKTGFTPVSAVFSEEATEQQQEAAENEENGGGEVNPTGDEEDSAASTAAYTAVVVAAISTLCF